MEYKGVSVDELYITWARQQELLKTRSSKRVMWWDERLPLSKKPVPSINDPKKLMYLQDGDLGIIDVVGMSDTRQCHYFASQCGYDI